MGQGWTKVNYLFILEPGEEEVTELNYKDARDKFVNICRKEYYMFYFDNNPIFYAYSYINKKFDFFNYLKKRDEILDNFVQNLSHQSFTPIKLCFNNSPNTENMMYSL